MGESHVGLLTGGQHHSCYDDKEVNVWCFQGKEHGRQCHNTLAIVSVGELGQGCGVSGPGTK